MELGERLGLGFHESKRHSCAQQAEYSGFMLDMVKGRLLVLAVKLEKMIGVLDEWILSAFVTARGLAKQDQGRGRASLAGYQSSASARYRDFVEAGDRL